MIFFPILSSVLEGQNGKIKIAEDGANTWEYGFPDSKQLYFSKRVRFTFVEFTSFNYLSFSEQVYSTCPDGETVLYVKPLRILLKHYMIIIHLNCDINIIQLFMDPFLKILDILIPSRTFIGLSR